RLVSTGKVEESPFRAPGGAIASTVALIGICAAMVGAYFLLDLRVAILCGILVSYPLRHSEFPMPDPSIPEPTSAEATESFSDLLKQYDRDHAHKAEG